MITSLTIRNFRSHRMVELTDLGRINLLLGQNNSGKTAALEALFFLALPSNPREVLARLNELRGYGPGADFEEIWDSWFHNWDHSAEIAVAAECRRQEPADPEAPLLASAQRDATMTLRIRPLLGDSGRPKRGAGVIEGAEFTEAVRGLLFQYKDTAGRSGTGSHGSDAQAGAQSPSRSRVRAGRCFSPAPRHTGPSR